jgi:hypothetical protein
MVQVWPIADGTLQARCSQIRRLAAPIQGWMADEAGSILYQLARFHAPNGNVAEIGSWKGRSTVWLGQAVKDRGEGVVYSVDTWKGSPTEELHRSLLRGYRENQLFEEFWENMQRTGVSGLVRPIRGESCLVYRFLPAGVTLGLLFIDGNHEYPAVLEDLRLWGSKVADGGYVVFDDVPTWAGPTRVVSEIEEGYRQVFVGYNICVLQKAPGKRRAAEHLQVVFLLDDEAFVAELYRQFLNREPDPDGLMHHVHQLRSGASKMEIAAAILSSREANFLYNY